MATFAVAALVAACDDTRSCETSDDCFSDESCVGGSCLLDEDGQRRDAGDAATAEDTTDRSDGFDPGEQTSCLLDPVDAPRACTDEYEGESTNNSHVEAYTFEFERAGCPEDQFVPAEANLTAKQCFDETQDWYKFQMFDCEDYQFRIQVDLVPAAHCETPLELVAFNCESENVRCETLENGRLRQTLVVERSTHPAFRNQYIGVNSAVEDQQVDYSLSVEVYR